MTPAVAGASVTLSAASAAGSAARLTTHLTPARATFLDTPATGYLGVLISNAPAVGDRLQLDVIKTNGQLVSLSVTNASGTNIGTLAQALYNLVNATPALQSNDGLLASEFYDNQNYCGQAFAQFLLFARSPGWPAARIQVALSGATNLLTLPAGTNRLEDNLSDLRPRNHLYVTAGLTNLPVEFNLDTAVQPDGYHELMAVACEGSHVRTQTRVARAVRIQNTALSATFTTLIGGPNSALEATLQFSVAASTNSISRIELFSTGGALASVIGQPSAVFSVAGTNLGIGLHPFYVLVTAADGSRYRTETQWIRLVGADAPFAVTIAAPAPRLAWPAAAGRRYDILSAIDLPGTFVTRDSVVPSNSIGFWIETNAGAAQRFYRVRTAN